MKHLLGSPFGDASIFGKKHEMANNTQMGGDSWKDVPWIMCSNDRNVNKGGYMKKVHNGKTQQEFSHNTTIYETVQTNTTNSKALFLAITLSNR